MAQTDSPPAGGARPTSGWQEGEVIVDHHGLHLPDMLLPADLPSGDEYELRVGMYLPATGERLPVRDSDGGSLGDSILLGWVTVASP